jgi:hypothetical protein
MDGRALRNVPPGSFAAQASHAVRRLLEFGWLRPGDISGLRLQLVDANRPAGWRQQQADRWRHRARQWTGATVGSFAEYSPRKRTIFLNEVGLEIDSLWRFPLRHYKLLVFFHEVGHSLIEQASVRLFDRLPFFASASSRNNQPWPAHLPAPDAVAIRADGTLPPFVELSPEQRFTVLFANSQHRLLAEEMYADALSIAVLDCLVGSSFAKVAGTCLMAQRLRDGALRPITAATVWHHATVPALQRVIELLPRGAWSQPASALELQGRLLECVAGGLSQTLASAGSTR